MTKFIIMLVGCSLALTVGARAEQDPKKKQKSKPAQQQQQHPQQHVAPKQHAMPNTNVQGQHTQHAPNINSAKVHHNNVPQQQLHTGPAVQSNKVHAAQTHKVHAAPTNNVPAVQANKVHAAQANKVHAAPTNKLPAVQANNLPAVQANKLQANKANVQNIRAQHVNFHARPSTNINSVHFNQNYRIQGAENWRGNHYEVFRSYRPEWHDQGWWHSHHNNIVLIGGGYYFWNAGYWFPAWGYDTSAAYYPYDGPIYVGSNARPFDQVVADVQSVLQEQGLYRGEVDGLVGPLTREALAQYQRAQGLEATAAIDQPTLESLGLS